ncbi:MAG: hypothetical protein HY040_06725, partial [Planctomycetes bacterium]|nr:hypothetical protein [Planctomycetota bacterium]
MLKHDERAVYAMLFTNAASCERRKISCGQSFVGLVSFRCVRGSSVGMMIALSFEDKMTTLALEDDRVRIPGWVTDLRSFRRWAHSDDFPEHGRISFFNGEVWVDFSMEQVFMHNQVKSEFTIVVGGRVKSNGLGRFFPDGVLLTNALAGLSTISDGVFVSEESMDDGLVRFI